MSKEKNEAWETAQLQNKQAEDDRFETFEQATEYYNNRYSRIFSLLGEYKKWPFDADLNGKTIAEIGPGNIPALHFCKNLGKMCWLFEPIVTGFLAKASQNENIALVPEPAENCNIPAVDEVWLFNVLSHVIDPVMLIDDAKKAGKTVLFFDRIYIPGEPIDTHTIHHFDLNFFKEHFVGEAKVIMIGGQTYCYGSYTVKTK